MAKLLFGVVYSLKNVSAKLGAVNSSNESSAEDSGAIPTSSNTLRSFSTGQYRVHFYESVSNFKFALLSDLAVDNLQQQLWELYSRVFVGHVINNALVPVEFGASKLATPDFVSACDTYLAGLPMFL
ncbi:hypothetical protein JCM33374_g1925 [Metschnikowia sp. JCM 33374]|nr:hypothetical protein JCM33374_g1925 [Metschnikowia sp. JCM 33374]